MSECETNLGCIVCGLFTGGSVLCAKCLAKAKERDEGKKINQIIDFISELCAEAEQRGYERGLASRAPEESKP